jgi:hypothetical protein
LSWFKLPRKHHRRNLPHKLSSFLHRRRWQRCQKKKEVAAEPQAATVSAGQFRIQQPAAPAEPPKPLVVEPSENLEESSSFESGEPSGWADDISARWQEFIDTLMADRPNVAAFLGLAKIVSTGKESVDLRFQSSFKFQFNDITRKETREYLSGKLKAFFRRPIDIHITIEPAGHAAAAPQRQLTTEKPARSLDDDMENEPIIRTVVEAFDGEIVG